MVQSNSGQPSFQSYKLELYIGLEGVEKGKVEGLIQKGQADGYAKRKWTSRRLRRPQVRTLINNIIK